MNGLRFALRDFKQLPGVHKKSQVMRQLLGYPAPSRGEGTKRATNYVRSSRSAWCPDLNLCNKVSLYFVVPESYPISNMSRHHAKQIGH